MDEHTTALAQGVPVICYFVDDTLDAAVLQKLAGGGIKLVALRCMNTLLAFITYHPDLAYGAVVLSPFPSP